VRDFGAEAQKAAEAHLAACQEAFWDYEEGSEEIESPASAPFCGCDTCIVREVLTAGWPFAYKSAKPDFYKLLEGFIEIVEKEAVNDRELAVLKSFRSYANDLMWSDDLIDDEKTGDPRAFSADGVGAEEEDQQQSGGDERQHDVLE
jgi:hypothetical protein